MKRDLLVKFLNLLLNEGSKNSRDKCRSCSEKFRLKILGNACSHMYICGFKYQPYNIYKMPYNV